MADNLTGPFVVTGNLRLVFSHYSAPQMWLLTELIQMHMHCTTAGSIAMTKIRSCGNNQMVVCTVCTTTAAAQITMDSTPFLWMEVFGINHRAP